MGLTTESIRFAIESINQRVEPMAAYLNGLESKLGDGDLGVTLIISFNRLASISDNLPDDVGIALDDSAKAMKRISGSSFGTLMGFALMAAAKQTKGDCDVPWSRLPALLQTALDAMIKRGGPELGDKTVMDSIDAVILEICNLDDPQLMLEVACAAADCALDLFHDRECKVGRARVFDNKTIGMDDPGMVAIKSMLAALKCEDHVSQHSTSTV